MLSVVDGVPPPFAPMAPVQLDRRADLEREAGLRPPLPTSPAAPRWPVRVGRWLARAVAAVWAWYLTHWTALGELAGASAALYGVYLILGLGASLIIGGLSLATVAFLREAKVI